MPRSATTVASTCHASKRRRLRSGRSATTDHRPDAAESPLGLRSPDKAFSILGHRQTVRSGSACAATAYRPRPIPACIAPPSRSEACTKAQRENVPYHVFGVLESVGAHHSSSTSLGNRSAACCVPSRRRRWAAPARLLTSGRCCSIRLARFWESNRAWVREAKSRTAAKRPDPGQRAHPRHAVCCVRVRNRVWLHPETMTSERVRSMSKPVARPT